MFSFGLQSAQATKNPFPSPPSNSVTDEEVQKRSTDCIYFLASPLTCKKGHNCDYRHSEAARMNPRDCRFWKVGNCLNPRCAFRHLPLDAQPPSAASITSTSSAPNVPQLVPASSSLHKSQTPCYFFSQGYCSKNDKCSFMHSLSSGDGALPKAPAAENGNMVVMSKRELSIPPQIASTNGRPVTSNGSYALSKVAGTSQKLLQNVSKLEKSMASKSNGSLATLRAPHQYRRPTFQANRPSLNVDESRPRQQTHQVKNGGGMFAQPADLTHSSNLCQWNTCWEDQSAVQSDSNQSSKSLSNSMDSNGKDLHEPSRSDVSEELLEVVPPSRPFNGPLQVASTHFSGPKVDKRGGQQIPSEKKDSSADLRNHLMKRRKKASILDVSEIKENKGQAGMAVKGNGIKSQSEQGEMLLAKAVINVVERSAEKSKGKESSLPLQKASGNNMSRDNMQGGAPSGTSERELASFTGPKTLAQIKEEKRASALTLSGKNISSTIPLQAVTKATSIKVVNTDATLAKSICVGTSCGKKSNAPISIGLASAKSVESKVDTPSVEFEGPKPLSMLLKRKRELDTDKLVSTPSVAFEAELSLRPKAEAAMPNKAELFIPLKAKVPTPGTCGELEEGKVGNHSMSCKPDSNQSSPCPPKEDLEVMLSPPRVGVEAAEDEMDSSEDGLISDIEMEDIGYDDAGRGIDEDDDDDFAKELRRFFTS